MAEGFVEVRQLGKSYGSLKAVDQLSFRIERGDVFGLLGPNGAGKTTTIEIMEGLRRADGGSVRIAGMDPQRDDFALKQIIGVQLQSSAMEERIKAKEALQLFGSYYKKALPAEQLLELVGLAEKRHTYYSKLSGGQQKRLALAIALVNDPQMVFLDEPTTGLDAQSRRNIWETVRRLKSEGRTVLLTTHYIEEAENLCDRVAIIDHGRIIAEGTPTELVRQSGVHHKIHFSVQRPLSEATIDVLVSKHGTLDCENDRCTLKVDHPSKPLIELIKLLEAEGNELTDLHLVRPSLEDVFIELTGRRIRD